VRALSHVFFFSTLVRCGEYRSQTGIQRKLNFVSVRTIKERSSSASHIWPQKADTGAWWEEEEGQEYIQQHFSIKLIDKYFSTSSTLSNADID
jgi:hypothetical protein